jgi:hypothetical protein
MDFPIFAPKTPKDIFDVHPKNLGKIVDLKIG